MCCEKCYHARKPYNKQVRDKYVGCSLINIPDEWSDEKVIEKLDEIKYLPVEEEILVGWIINVYPDSDKEGSAFSNFMLITPKNACCKYFVKRK